MSDLSNKVPRFFSVFLPEFCSHRLKICSSFKVHLGEILDEAIIKRSTTNQKWKVGLVKEDKEFVFDQGWNAFVEENGLSTGEFMVFQYHGKCRFSVDIFGTNGMKKMTPAKRKMILGDANGEMAVVSRVQNSVMIPCKKRGRPSAYEKGNKGILKANKLMPTLKNPSFMVCITDSYADIATMHLPSGFMSRYMRRRHDSVDLQTSENTWSVRLLSYQNSTSGKTYYKLGDGFGEFVHDNNIQGGDVCVFEAVDLPGMTLKVTTFGSEIK
ncbi:hypothetical protein RND81_13G218900 [Saponaria officinalis]|uniref:TF-B3 domain-containing protein n=1 Tax=Saponaria officinalis TaxID=3572 RepID=A0AAW1H0T7_SAPOF